MQQRNINVSAIERLIKSFDRTAQKYMKLSPSRKGRYLEKKLVSKKKPTKSIVKIVKAITSLIDVFLTFITLPNQIKFLIYRSRN